MSIQAKKMQVLVNKMFNVKIGESPCLTHEVVQMAESYDCNLRKNEGFKPGNPRSVNYETTTIFILRPRLWIILSLKELKTKTKN